MECGELGAGLRIRVQPGGEVTAGAARVQGAAPVLSPTELHRRGSFSLRLGGGENLTSLGDLGLEADWGLTSCSGGRMLGTRTSVKVLLSRLCREREGRRAWLGVGVVGVQKLVLAG